MTYIQRKDRFGLETVDEFDTYVMAVRLILEYRFAEPTVHFYLSSRPCKAWNDN